MWIHCTIQSYLTTSSSYFLLNTFTSILNFLQLLFNMCFYFVCTTTQFPVLFRLPCAGLEAGLLRSPSHTPWATTTRTPREKKMKGNRRLGVRAWWWERNETHSQRLLTSSSQKKRVRKLRTARLWRTRAYLTWNEALCPELKVDGRKWNRSNSVKRQVWSAGCFKNNYILI